MKRKPKKSVTELKRITLCTLKLPPELPKLKGAVEELIAEGLAALNNGACHVAQNYFEQAAATINHFRRHHKVEVT